MLQEAENTVYIEGLLSEIDLEYGSFTKKSTNQKIDSIGGKITIQVNQVINDNPVMLEVPVHMFAAKLTNKGTPNPAYENIERIKNEFVSIAAAGGTQEADAVRIDRGRLIMNEFPNRAGGITSYPRINASFVTKINKEKMSPKATFEASFVVGKKAAEVDREGVETGRYKITGVLPQYGGKVDVFEFLVVNPKVIEAINQYWSENDTVLAAGRLNFSSRTETIVKEIGFGEPQEMTRTTSVSELIITGGAPEPFDEERAYNIDDIKSALAERSARLEKEKEEAVKATAKTRPAPRTDSKGRSDLGF